MVRTAALIAVACALALAVLTVFLGGGRVTFINGSFLLSFVLFTAAVFLTRPTIDRRRTIQDADDSPEAEAEETEYEPIKPPSRRLTEKLERPDTDPKRQYLTGLQLGLAGALLLVLSFLIRNLG